MDKKALEDLLLSLQATALKMRDTGTKMTGFTDKSKPWFRHGGELIGGAIIIEEWMQSIRKEIDD